MSCLPATDKTLPRFREVCACERLFGSRSLCAHIAGTAQSFLLEDALPAALSLTGGVLTVVSPGIPDLPALERFILEHNEIIEVDSTLALCTQLQEKLGGDLESSFFMRCDAPVFPEEDSGIRILPSPAPEIVFGILQGSHPYYQKHLQFAPWSTELKRWQELGLTELYALEVEGQLVGTGRILSQDDLTGAIGAVAVLPEYRNRGYGRQMSAFLTRRVLGLGKTPVLISGYDAVSALYRSIGYQETGRWGELYFHRCH